MKLPDGSRTPPFLQLIKLITSPLEYLETFAQRYGDTFTAHWSNFPPFVLLSNPQAIQELFTFQPRYVSVWGSLLAQSIVGENEQQLSVCTLFLSFRTKNDEVVKK